MTNCLKCGAEFASLDKIINMAKMLGVDEEQFIVYCEDCDAMHQSSQR